jgi:ribulose-5-phosphate 4-epimerase/fuculose-1-phosphate aldolase
MRSHGVMVLGASVAEAWDDLYYLERACEVQRLAMTTGRPLKPVPPALAAKTYAQMREGDRESARLHLESIKRILAQEAPDFAR